MRGAVYAPKKNIKDYSRKPRAGNPLFPRDGGASSSRGPMFGPMKILTLGVLGLFAVLFGIGYVVWGAPLRLDEISIVGATPTTERRIRTILDEQRGKKVLGVLPQSNTLLFRASKAEAALKASFFFDQLALRKKLPHSLIVEVKERDAKAAVVADDKLLALDDGCTIIRELTTEEVSGLPYLPTGVQAVTITDSEASGDNTPAPTVTVSDAVSTALPATASPAIPRNAMPVLSLPNLTNSQPGKVVCSQEMLKFINEAFVGLSEPAQAMPLWFVPDDEAQSLDVMMEGDWHVFLSSTLPFDSQIDRLKVVLREKIGADRPRLKYVDLRYNETVFFRLKD